MSEPQLISKWMDGKLTVGDLVAVFWKKKAAVAVIVMISVMAGIGLHYVKKPIPRFRTVLHLGKIGSQQLGSRTVLKAELEQKYPGVLVILPPPNDSVLVELSMASETAQTQLAQVTQAILSGPQTQFESYRVNLEASIRDHKVIISDLQKEFEELDKQGSLPRKSESWTHRREYLERKAELRSDWFRALFAVSRANSAIALSPSRAPRVIVTPQLLGRSRSVVWFELIVASVLSGFVFGFLYVLVTQTIASIRSYKKNKLSEQT